jgi:Xaa-Pro aminopeptidase
LEVYQTEGFGICYRTGRGVGYSYLEPPEFKEGDKTILRPGMTFAVDGGITIEGEFGARVGDSVVVTDEGFEYLTPFPKKLQIL